MSHPPPTPSGSASPPFDPVLATLDRVVRLPAAGEHLMAAADELLDRFPDGELSACVALELRSFQGLPVHIRSVRLFALKAGASGPRERHPNSYQRVMSLRGSGVIRVWAGPCGETLPGGGGGFHRRVRRWKESASVVHQLQSQPDAPLHSRWSSVPPGLWHRPSAGPDTTWLTLALHTADSVSLIDEYVEEDGIQGGAGPTVS
jgi:hypothetical protein